MAETIKQYKNTIFAGLSLFSVLLTVLVLAGIVILPNFAAADSVSVTATISEWISIAETTTTLSLGTLVNGSGVLTLGSATTGITLSSNSDDGYSVTIQGANAGLKNGSTSTIATAASGATSTCNVSDPGTDAYGAQATSTNLTVSSPFNVTGNTVGSLATSSQKLVSSVYSTSTKTATLTVQASANKYDRNGTYTDTLTVTAVATP
jgi:hypothetical protein